MASDEASARSEPRAEAPTEREPGPANGAGRVNGAPLGDILGELAGELVRRGRSGFGRAAARGRTRLERRQLEKDRAAMYQKLGREVCALVDGGEVDHPGLARGVARIRELEAKIAEGNAAAGSPGAGAEDDR